MTPPITTILMLSANPQGSSAQRLDQEKRDIYEGLQRSRHRDRFRLETHSAARPRDLQRAMLDLNPQIVHFSGQGEAEAGLVFEDAIGQPQLIDAEALASLFELFADKLQCVVLNACYSEAQAEAIAQHIPYVVGMSAAIEDRAAIEFAVGFYDALGAGKDFEFAYQFGRSAARRHGTADWMPVLKTHPNAAPRQAVTIAPPSSQPFSPAIYSASTWVERSEITAPLLQILQGNCRVLALTGITGIGKTALAERLISELRDQKRFCRLNLDEGSVSAEFSGSGAALLRSLGEEPTLEDQKDPQTLLAHLLQLLRSHPYRVQIDSMEKLLEGDDRQGWSKFCDPLWLDLLQQVLAGQDCQSQLVLTTQDLPAGLEAIGSRYPQFWRCQAVRGLSEAEQLELFAKRGLSEGKTDYLKRIGKLYDGHPLVLRVIAEDIKACGGNVQRYWQQGKFAEQEADRPAQLSRRKLQLEVKQRVKEALARLPEDALQLLCRSAVYRRPVPESFWLALLPDCTHPETTLELLKARSLVIEEWEEGAWLGTDGEIPLRQHNLIRSVAYELLTADTAVWQTAECIAAEQWLNNYEAIPEAPNLEQVRGSLEAFDHYFDIRAYQIAAEIPYRILKAKNEVYWQLLIWGYVRELIPLHKKLLLIARETGNRRREGAALGNLGIAYNILGNYAEAIKFHQQHLAIAREMGDREREGKSLSNLGIAYNGLGNYAEAIDYHQQHLAIAREMGDREGESIALGNLGIAYNGLGNYAEAIDYHQQSLVIAREIGDRQAEGGALVNWGNTLIKLEQYLEALEYLQASLEIFREIEDRANESEALLRLAELHQKLGSIATALEYCDRALAIAIELGIPLVKDCEALREEINQQRE